MQKGQYLFPPARHQGKMRQFAFGYMLVWGAEYIHFHQLKGHGNEADFLGFLHKSVLQRSHYTTFQAVPILTSNSQRYS
jgi:hypothetical protein